MPTLDSQSRIRWLPAAIIVVLTILAIILLWSLDAPQRQWRVLHTVLVLMLSFLLILLWLFFFSWLRWKVRLLAFGAVVLILLLSAALFRVKGFSGDLVPLLEWRWSGKAAESLMGSDPTAPPFPPAGGGIKGGKDYPQFLGPHRNGTVQGIKLARDWSKRPPQLLWRQPIGAGWSASLSSEVRRLPKSSATNMKWLSVTTCIPGRNGGAIAIAIGMKRRLRALVPAQRRQLWKIGYTR